MNGHAVDWGDRKGRARGNVVHPNQKEGGSTAEQKVLTGKVENYAEENKAPGRISERV
jgi:hypothetical protein